MLNKIGLKITHIIFCSLLFILNLTAITNDQQILIFDKTINAAKQFINSHDHEQINSKISSLNRKITNTQSRLIKQAPKIEKLQIELEKRNEEIKTKIQNRKATLKEISRLQNNLNEYRKTKQQFTISQQKMEQCFNQLQEYSELERQLTQTKEKFCNLESAFTLYKIAIDDSQITQDIHIDPSFLLSKIQDATIKTKFGLLNQLFNTSEEDNYTNIINELTKEENKEILNQLNELIEQIKEIEEILIQFISNINNIGYETNLLKPLNINQSYKEPFKKILLSSIGYFGLGKTLQFIPKIKNIITSTHSFIDSAIIIPSDIMASGYMITQNPKSILPLLGSFLTKLSISGFFANFISLFNGIPHILASALLPFGPNITYNLLYEFKKYLNIKKQRKEVTNQIINIYKLTSILLNIMSQINNILQNNESLKPLGININAFIEYNDIQTNLGKLLNYIQNINYDKLAQDKEKAKEALRIFKNAFSYIQKPEETGISSFIKAFVDIGIIDSALSLIEKIQNQEFLAQLELL